VNILQVAWEGLSKSGVPKIIMDITKNLSNDNDTDVVLFTKDKRYYDEEFLSYGGQIYRIPKYEGKNKFIKKANYYLRGPKVFWGMLKILRNKKYDVIHCHNEYESGICILAAFFAGVKIRISHLHNAEYRSTRKNIFNVPYHSILKFLLCRFSTHILCCSENPKKDFFKNKKYDSKIKVVLNCIDLEKYDTKLKKKEKSDKYIMTHIGQFSYKKNQMFILDLMPEVIKRIQNVELHLIGFGEEYKKKLEKKIDELKIREYVKILPPDSNIVEELGKTDLFIFPSVTEGLGIVLFEAQAMEVPCLASDAVSRETDLGMIKYKSLNDGIFDWANEIEKIHNGEIKFKINNEKLRMRDNSYYIKEIERIYKGENV